MRHDSTAMEPDLKVAGFSLWAFGRPTPNLDVGWDEAWIETHVIVEMGAVRVEMGDGFTSMVLEMFCNELDALHRTLSGTAVLQGDTLVVKVNTTATGHCPIEVHTVPVGFDRPIVFHFEVDQTHIGGLLAASRRLLDAFPIPERYRKTT